LGFEQATEKSFSRLVIATALDKNIDDIAVLIDRAPEVLPLTLNRDKDFVEVPGITQATLTLFEFSSIGRSKLPTPLTNGFIRDRDASFGEKFFHSRKLRQNRWYGQTAWLIISELKR
jgi:hypothetical protein